MTVSLYLTKDEQTMKVGDRVTKRTGYPFPGKIVSMFLTSNYDCRVVVECEVEGVKGCLHIFDPEQLTRLGDE